MTSSPLTWPAAQKQAWAEAKAPQAVERCGTKIVVHIDAAQPGGVIAALARHGVHVKPAAECVALIGSRVVEIGQHLTEIVHTAALRRQRYVDALMAGGRVVDLRRDGDEWRA